MQSKPYETIDIAKLPIFKNYDTSEIVQGAKNLTGGQVKLYNIIRLGVFGGLAYGAWVYVLPKLFIALGQMLAVGIGIFAVLFLFMARNAIFTLLKNLARFLHKLAIKSDVWAEFERQKEKMRQNKVEFAKSEGNIANLEKVMKSKALGAENEAKELQEHMLNLKASLDKDRKKLESITNQDSDEYNDLLIKIDKSASTIEGAMHRYKKATEMVDKYGARAHTMGRLRRKLAWVASKMDIKILDFDNTIYLLQVDYNYAKDLANSTDAAKKTMLFEEDWQLTYAMDLVSSTIASDLSRSAMNLKDIDNLTSNFSTDNEALFKKLDALTERIATGNEKISEAKDFNNLSKPLTSEQKTKAGPNFGGMDF